MRAAFLDAFTDGRNIVWGVLAAVLTYFATAIFGYGELLWTAVTALDAAYAAEILWAAATGLIHTMAGHSFALTVLTAFFVGVNVTILSQYLRMQRQFSTTTGGPLGAGALSVIIPGCSACAASTGLIASLGLGGVFTLLPFGGAEIQALMILLLIALSGYLLKQISTGPACNIA